MLSTAAAAAKGWWKWTGRGARFASTATSLSCRSSLGLSRSSPSSPRSPLTCPLRCLNALLLPGSLQQRRSLSLSLLHQHRAASATSSAPLLAAPASSSWRCSLPLCSAAVAPSTVSAPPHWPRWAGWWLPGGLGGALLLLCAAVEGGEWVAGGGLGVSECCGIIAFIGDEAAAPYLLEGLHILQNRGYDSAGLTTINGEGELVTTKYASKGSTSDSIKLLQADAMPRHGSDRSGIAHTRWATHGGKTDANAHPHLDYRKRIALVHNGTIENSSELKAELEAVGIPFTSETDTEVIAQLIGHHLDQGLPVLDAVKKTLARLEGTWGLAIIHKDEPHQVIACRNGSPLVIGLSEQRMFVASEISAFSRHTSQYISLNDGEMAVINGGEVSLDLSRLQTAPAETIELSPAPFPHWTIKEIMEQPQAISRTLNYGARFDNDGNVKLGGLQSNADMLLGMRHLVISACGTSLFAGMYGAALLRSLRCFDTVQTVDAAEVTSESLPPSAGGLLVISQSGETKDTHRSLQVAEQALVPTFSIVNQVGSLIARSTKSAQHSSPHTAHSDRIQSDTQRAASHICIADDSTCAVLCSVRVHVHPQMLLNIPFTTTGDVADAHLLCLLPLVSLPLSVCVSAGSTSTPVASTR